MIARMLCFCLFNGKHNKFLFILTVVFALNLPVLAEEKFAPPEVEPLSELTWGDCIKEAKKNHPDLVSAQEKLNQARASKAIITSAVLPQISLTATQDMDTYSYSYGLTGRLLLFDGFKTSHDIAAASENIKSAEYSYQATSSSIRQRLKVAFVELLRAQELFNITEDIAQRRKRNVELIKLRYEAGREHKGSLLIAQASLAQALFEVTQARRSIALGQRRLTMELGRTKLIPIRAKGEFKILCISRERPVFENLAESNPLLRGFITRKEAARFGLKSAKADFFPQISASMSASRVASEFSPEKGEWSIGVSLSFPLFEGGRRKAQVSRARAIFNQVQADERSDRASIILTLEEAWIQLQNVIDNVEVRQKFLEAGQKRAGIAQAQYAIGLISFDNWTIIEDDLVRAKKSFLDAQANALIVEANWIQAKGGTLDYEK